jgi:hypothetical protein
MKPVIALALLVAACGSPAPVATMPREPARIYSGDIVLACDQDDLLEKMNCMLEPRRNMDRTTQRLQERVEHIRAAWLSGKRTEREAEYELADLEVRAMDSALARLGPPPPGPVAAAPIAPLHPGWLAGAYGPGRACIPGAAGQIVCY